MQGPSEPPERVAARGTNGAREAVQRWRLVLHRTALEGDPAEREAATDWMAALEKSGLPVAGLDLPKPKPRVALAAPLTAAIPGEAELADLVLVERLPRWRVREALGRGLPPAFRLLDLYDVWLGAPSLPGQVVASVYRATLAPPADVSTVRAAARALMTSETLPRERRRGETSVAYDLRPFLEALEVMPTDDGGASIRMTLRHDPARGIGRPEETLSALAEAMGSTAVEDTSLVRERLVLAEPTSPVPTPPRTPMPTAGRGAGPGGGGRPGGGWPGGQAAPPPGAPRAAAQSRAGPTHSGGR